MSSPIDGTITLQAFDGDVKVVSRRTDHYPSLEIYKYEDYNSGEGKVDRLDGMPQGNIWELIELWPGDGG